MNFDIVITFLILAATVWCTQISFRWGWKALIVYLALLVTLFVISQGVNFANIAIPLIVGYVGGYTFKKQKDFEFFIIVSSFILTAVLIGIYYYLMLVMDMDIVTIAKDEMMKILAEGKAPKDLVRLVIDDYNSNIQTIRNLIPFSLFLYALIMSCISYQLMRVFFTLRALFNRIERIDDKFDLKTIQGIEAFRLNDYFIFVLIGGWVIFLLSMEIDNNALEVIGLNAALIASILYFLQGIGVIKFLLIKKGWSTYIQPLVYLALFLSFGIWAISFLVIMQAGFGTLDFWADFRKHVQKINKEEL